MREVAGLLEERRLVTVTGPGRSGKTRLAAEIARRVAVGAEHAADCSGGLCLPGSSAYRTQVGPGETGGGHGLLLRDRLGGILGGRIRREPP